MSELSVYCICGNPVTLISTPDRASCCRLIVLCSNAEHALPPAVPLLQSRQLPAACALIRWGDRPLAAGRTFKAARGRHCQHDPTLVLRQLCPLSNSERDPVVSRPGRLTVQVRTVNQELARAAIALGSLDHMFDADPVSGLPCCRRRRRQGNARPSRNAAGSGHDWARQRTQQKQRRRRSARLGGDVEISSCSCCGKRIQRHRQRPRGRSHERVRWIVDGCSARKLGSRMVVK
jgi:hypothetical protein